MTYRKSTRPVSISLLFALALSALLLVAGPVAADEFELSDGRRLVGSIVRELGDLVSIKQEDGKIVTIEKKLIKYHKKRDTKYDKFKERHRKLGENDTPGRIDLIDWCKSNGLEKEVAGLYREIISIDPHHKAAREALGYEIIGGEWFLKGSPEAAAKRKALADAAAAEKAKKAGKSKGASSSGSDRGQVTKKRNPSGNDPALKNAPKVALKLTETVGGKAPELSLLTGQLTNFLKRLKQPMAIVGEDDPAEYLLEVTMEVKFVKTHKFYGKMSLFDIYAGVGTLSLKEKASGKVVADVRKLKEKVSVGVEREDEEKLGYAYSESVQALLHNLSKKQFFQDRGAEIIRRTR